MADDQRKRICVAFPSGDLVNVRFLKSLLDLFTYSTQSLDIFWANFVSSRITDNRNNLVKLAQNGNAEYILFIDSDMTFPPDALKRLLRYDADIVCATASKRNEECRDMIGIPANQSDTITSKTLIEMESIGLPFMLIKMSVFDKIKKPYFAEPENGEDLIPEDAYFCAKVRDAGVKLFCDLPLSMSVGHLGIKEYKIEPVKSAPPVLSIVA
jgi:hypothetical protein